MYETYFDIQTVAEKIYNGLFQHPKSYQLL